MLLQQENPKFNLREGQLHSLPKLLTSFPRDDDDDDHEDSNISCYGTTLSVKLNNNPLQNITLVACVVKELPTPQRPSLLRLLLSDVIMVNQQQLLPKQIKHEPR